MKISIIIVSWNVKDYLLKCLASITEPAEIIVVDNASSDGSAQAVKKKYPSIRMIENQENKGFAAANNQGIKVARGEYILILNPDTEVKPGAIDTLAAFLKAHPEAGAVAPKLLYPDGRLQESLLRFPTLSAMFVRALFIEGLWPNNPVTRKYLMRDFKYDRELEVYQPMGAAIMLKREALNKVGLFDERNFMFFDEVDLCYRIKKAGFKIFFTPRAEIVHHLSKSIGKWGVFNLSRNWSRSRNYYFKKHHGHSALFLLYIFDILRLVVIFILLLLLVIGLQSLLRVIS